MPTNCIFCFSFQYVKEITVDDVIDALIQALKNDRDVFTSTSGVYSDPIYGKHKFSTPPAGLNYLDPDYYLEQIYGSPYGMSLTQYGFGGQGFPMQQSSGYGEANFISSCDRYLTCYL